MPTLREILPAERIRDSSGPLDVDVHRIRTDSRQVEPGDVFVCLPGYRTEGGETRADRHEFAATAVERGAVALVVQRPLEVAARCTIVQVADTWTTAAIMADRYYDHPSRRMTMIGITGTSGKTSTAYFVDSILRAAGHRTARIGTISYRIGDREQPASQTTPEADILQGLLGDAVGAGCTATVMEVSSHALALHRVAEIAFDVAVFTNLSQDHLNFHRDMDEYREAKGRLFAQLGRHGKPGTAVLNLDDSGVEHMRHVNRGSEIGFGLGPAAAVRAREITMTLHALRFHLVTPAGERAVELHHLGDYSVYNALAAATTGLACGIDLDTIVQGLGATPAVPGRFELVDERQGYTVVVDYAHKPDALERLLDSARRLRPNRIITVFGCGGDRDRGKRPQMGRIAMQRSDRVVVTSDNPRTEEPGAIIEDILAGVREIDPQAKRHVAEPDRARSIRTAVETAASGDMVIIAGKGHETYQILGRRRIDFDDREHARTAIREREAQRPHR